MKLPGKEKMSLLQSFLSCSPIFLIIEDEILFKDGMFRNNQFFSKKTSSPPPSLSFSLSPAGPIHLSLSSPLSLPFSPTSTSSWPKLPSPAHPHRPDPLSLFLSMADRWGPPIRLVTHLQPYPLPRIARRPTDAAARPPLLH